MKCSVWRSEKKEGCYIYLHEDMSLEDLPEALSQTMGLCVEVMKLDLNARTQLATEDIDKVKDSLANQGYHVQLPPKQQDLAKE